jgi:hypothetical protein
MNEEEIVKFHLNFQTIIAGTALLALVFLVIGVLFFMPLPSP